MLRNPARPHSPGTRGGWKRLAIVLALAVGIGTVIAGPAAAHYPTITASADCSPDVAYTSTSWSTDADGAHDRVRVDYRVDGGAWQHAAYGAYTPDASSFSGTLSTGSVADLVEVQVTAEGAWTSGAAGGQSETVSVSPSQSCEADPVASATVDCAGFVVTLSNEAGTADTIFSVRTPDGSIEEVPVAAGESVTRTYPVVEDARTSVQVSVGSKVLVEEFYDADCKNAKPVPTIAVDCDGWHVVLSNEEGTEDTSFTVTTPSGDTEVVSVPAGQTETRDYPVADGVEQTVSVSSPHLPEPVSKTYTGDCEPPPVPAPDSAIAVDCDGYDVDLLNTQGTAPAVFEVTTPDGTVETVTVPAGDYVTRSYPIAHGTTTTVIVSAPGTDTITATFTADCFVEEDEPSTDEPPVDEPPVDEPPVVENPPAQDSPPVNRPPTSYPEPVDSPVSLPDTGAPEMTWMVLSAAMLLGLGGALIAGRGRLFR